MEKRYEGFLAPHGLYILDTQTGEVRLIAHDSEIQSVAPVAISSVVTDTKVAVLPTDQNNFTPFENEVISSYPYLIAKPFLDLVKEKDARMKCKLMVDTFTAVLKYMALQLASEYIRAKDVKDVQVHQTLTKDLSRPLISAWNLLIAKCLPVLKDNNVPLFSPEIKEAYEKLESKCKEPFMVSQSYSDENGEIKTKTKKLGKIQALINYRNGLAHGFNQSQTRAQKEFDEYYPLLCDILQEVRFTSRYTLWHVESSREGVNGIRLMGASPSLKKVDFSREGVNPAVSPLFLLNDATSEILPLYAFFDVDETSEAGLPELGKDVFVFEGNTKNTVIYLSSSGEHLEKSSRFQHWKELLAQKQLEVEWVNEKNLTLEVLHTIGTHISSIGIQALIASAKYLREATIPRQDFNEMLDSFSYGTYNGFVLGGESGIGKSTLLAQKTEQWQSEGHMVTFYRGSALNQSDLTNKFLRDCALRVSYLEDFLSLANPVFSNTEKKCYLIIDALNEFAGDLNELIDSVENMVAQAANYPWFKIVVSIRDSAYYRVSSKFGELVPMQYYTVEEDKGGDKVKTNIIRLQPFTKDFVEQLYNAYREYKWKDSADIDTEGYYKFRPLTLFSELNPEGSTVQLIRSPLMARLVMQSFHRAKLPQQLKNDDAMRLYLDNIVLEKIDDNLGFPERKKLLTLLTSELDKQFVERLERDELFKNPALRTYLVNTQKDSAYIQLLDLGVLMEEWEGENCYVRFAFDKFLEFLLAELHWPRVHDAETIMSLCKQATSFKILQGAIEIIIVRFCLNNQSEILVQLIDLADKESDDTQSLIKDLGVRILFSLSNEQYLIFESVVNLFPKDPGEMDLAILQKLLDKLFLTGNLKGFEFTLKVAVEEAKSLNNRKALSAFLSNQASFDELQGRIELAEKLYCESLEISRQLEDKNGIGQSLNSFGRLNYKQGKIEDAEKLFLESLEIRRQLADKIGIAGSLNNLGVLNRAQGKIEDAEKLYMESLEIKRQLGDTSGIGVSLNSLGNLYKGQGKIEDAEKMYLESLEIRKKLGNKSGISASLNNLGMLYKDQGKIEKAEKLYMESLEIKRQLGDKSGISASLNNLGILYEHQGKIEKAEKLYMESLEIKRQLGDKSGISQSLNNLGGLAFEKGDEQSAKQLFADSISIKRELKATVVLLASIHRAFHMFNNEERLAFLREIASMEKKDFTAKEKCWLADIELIEKCLNGEVVTPALILSETSRIIDFAKEAKMSDIDDLPVEAFYIASKKLLELNESTGAINLAKQALDWIGDRKTLRKNELEKILELDKPMQNKK